MNTAFVLVKDANGDHILTIGPMNIREAQAYVLERDSKRGEWYTEIVNPDISAHELAWEPGTSVYEAMEKRGL